jgi:hypothetical protein
MAPVTAKAKKWLVLLQQIIGNGAMHLMAEVTILLHRGVSI